MRYRTLVQVPGRKSSAFKSPDLKNKFSATNVPAAVAFACVVGLALSLAYRRAAALLRHVPEARNVLSSPRDADCGVQWASNGIRIVFDEVA